jgi:hypothetical protein
MLMLVEEYTNECSRNANISLVWYRARRNNAVVINNPNTTKQKKCSNEKWVNA